MCCYKTNYELYAAPESPQHPPQIIVNPLATLYPHVSALQTPYYYSTGRYQTNEWYGDSDTGYWAGAYACPEGPEYKMDDSRRDSETSAKTTKIMTKLRRILGRDARSVDELRKKSCHSS